MQTINRLMTNICSDNLVAGKNFYTRLFDFQIGYDSDWFIQLVARNGQLELGLIDRHNAVVPKVAQTTPQGFYITFVVDDIDRIFQIAQAEGFEIVSEPTDTPYGQRQLVLKDPDGTVVDVSAPIPDFKF